MQLHYNKYSIQLYYNRLYYNQSIRRLSKGKLQTIIFRKETSTDLYMNWNSHAPFQWKSGASKNFGKRSILMCSDQYLLKKNLTI